MCSCRRQGNSPDVAVEPGAAGVSNGPCGSERTVRVVRTSCDHEI